MWIDSSRLVKIAVYSVLQVVGAGVALSALGYIAYVEGTKFWAKNGAEQTTLHAVPEDSCRLFLRLHGIEAVINLSAEDCDAAIGATAGFQPGTKILKVPEGLREVLKAGGRL